MEAPYVTTEAALAELLGIERKVLTGARYTHLTGPDLWANLPAEGICLTMAGLEKMCAALQVEIPESLLESLTTPEGSEKKDAAPVTVEVLRLAKLNNRVLFAREKKDGPEITVMVRDARQFLPGQRLTVRLEGGIAHLHGHQPRTRRQAAQASRKAAKAAPR